MLAGTPLPRLPPRTMLNVLLLCCGLLQGIQAILAADLSRGHLQKGTGGLEGADRARYSSLLRKVKEVSAEPDGESWGPPMSSHCPPPATRRHAQCPNVETGTPRPGSDAGHPSCFSFHWLVRAAWQPMGSRGLFGRDTYDCGDYQQPPCMSVSCRNSPQAGV